MADVRAEEILRQSLETVASDRNYEDPDFKVKKVSTEGANYTSYLFEATISSKDKNDLNLFAKVAAIGEKMRSQAPMQVFEIEKIFYTDLLKEFRQLEEKYELSKEHKFQVPEIYICNPKKYEETFVMENLNMKGYSLHDRFQSVSWEYASTAFTELAKLHALSMALKHYNPEGYHRYLGDFKFQFTELMNTDMQPMIENMMKKSIAVVKDENKDRLMKYLGSIMEGNLDGFTKYYLPGDNATIRHGDFRPSNLMHKKKKDGSLDIVVVDFQTMIPGSPVIDLFYFIFLGTDKAFRDEYYEELLTHYYKSLSAALSRLGLDPEETYSKKRFDDDVKENVTFGLLIALTTLGLITVESVDAPKVDGDMDMHSFGNIKHGKVFAERLNGILEDFIAWGIL